ncbi:MAG: hypothetical protein DQL93_0015 (endogenous virus) [Lactobacillus phage ViSo-2018b]|nr:MAG: hypothetical protein DQL93_0015 [Lactobacillus phage ViSo-2018b]
MCLFFEKHRKQFSGKRTLNRKGIWATWSKPAEAYASEEDASQTAMSGMTAMNGGWKSRLTTGESSATIKP